MADHQTAHIYINDPSVKEEVKALLSATPGVEEIRETDFSGLSSAALERLPEFTAVAAPDAWFTYYYWLDDTKAPDFARCVDIHRKPGYDPAEMFFDPGLAFPMFHAAAFLLKKKLGFRALMKVIPLNGDQVKGSMAGTGCLQTSSPCSSARPPCRKSMLLRMSIKPSSPSLKKNNSGSPQRASGRGSYSRPGTSR